MGVSEQRVGTVIIIFFSKSLWQFLKLLGTIKVWKCVLGEVNNLQVLVFFHTNDSVGRHLLIGREINYIICQVPFGLTIDLYVKRFNVILGSLAHFSPCKSQSEALTLGVNGTFNS